MYFLLTKIDKLTIIKEMERKKVMGKIWKKLLFIILIIACLFNIITKLVKRNSFKDEIRATLQYFNGDNNTIVENEEITESGTNAETENN